MVQARFVFHEMVAFGHRVATSNQMIQLACINGWVEEFSMLLIHYSKDPCFSVIHYNISSLSHERIEFTMRSRLEHSIDINSQHLNECIHGMVIFVYEYGTTDQLFYLIGEDSRVDLSGTFDYPRSIRISIYRTYLRFQCVYCIERNRP
jgi:hypothetical protein